MHRLDQRTYVGTAGETVTLTTKVDGGGQAGVEVDGQPIAGNQFPLSSTPGATRRATVSLVGPQGASCVVTISPVDGATDSDFLLCTVHNPAPSHQYDCSTAAAAALATLRRAKPTRPAPATRNRTIRPAKKPRKVASRNKAARKRKKGAK